MVSKKINEIFLAYKKVPEHIEDVIIQWLILKVESLYYGYVRPYKEYSVFYLTNHIFNTIFDGEALKVDIRLYSFTGNIVSYFKSKYHSNVRSKIEDLEKEIFEFQITT